MLRPFACCLLLASPAVGATPQTGVTATLPAMLCLALAGIILLGLLARRQLLRVIRAVSGRTGRLHLRQVVASHALDSRANLVLPGSNGSLTRTDLAVLTSAAIVCIRLRDFNGTVFGNPNDAQWTVVDGTSRRQFLNPLLQNAGRVRAVEAACAGMPVENLVVFTGNAQFSMQPAANVIHVSQLARWLHELAMSMPAADDPDSSWLSLCASARTDADAQRDFEAELSFG